MKREPSYEYKYGEKGPPCKKLAHNDSGLVSNLLTPTKATKPEVEQEVDVFADTEDSEIEASESSSQDVHMAMHSVNKEKAYLMNNPFINEWPGPKTKVRDLGPKIDEIANALSWVVISNDGNKEIMKLLIDLKNIISEQLPNMPKEYITRLLLDGRHYSLVGIKNNKIVGGITFRSCDEGPDRKFIEIVFCAVAFNQQIQGYGSRLMNQLKNWAKDEGYLHMLTYADDNAVGYFKRQEIEWDRSKWDIGFLKLYDSATLMHCSIDPEIDYCEITEQIRRQRVTLLKKIREISNQHLIHPGIKKSDDGTPPIFIDLDFPIHNTTLSITNHEAKENRIKK